MQVRLYSFSKRNKSTKIPSTSYTTFNCTLKDFTSITKPTLLIQTSNIINYNYCYIPSFNRYYFITDCASYENMWEISCIEDELATYKAAIGVTSCNILYATGSTKNIADTRIPVTADIIKGHNYKAIDGLTITEGSGAVILGITGKGSFGTYLMQDSGLVSELLDGVDDWWTSSVSTSIDSVKQCFFGGSAAECLKGAIALPLVIGGPDVSSGSTENLYLGNYPCMLSDGSTHIKGYRITKPIIKSTTSINIPWQSTDWKRISGYTTISLYIPFIGIINLPATELQDDTSISILYSINVTSGDISVEVRGTQSLKKFSTASSNCAMNTPYGSTGINTNKATQAIVSGLGTLVAIGGAVATGGASALLEAGIGAGLANTATNTIEALGGSASGSGGLGGGSSQGLDKVIHCFCITKQLTDTQTHFNPLIGKPYMAVGTPNQFSGFVQTDGFQFENEQAYSTEKDNINRMMDSGIYYE